MFGTKNRSAIISEGSKNLLKEQVLNLKVAQEALLYKIQTKKIYEADPKECPNIDFTGSPSVQYSDGVLLMDLTTDEQIDLGLNIIHGIITQTTSNQLHTHKDRYQIIFVKKGIVIDNLREKEYKEGDIIFIQKKEEHSIKYMQGSEIILISIPGLNVIENIQQILNTNK